ncbi:MAG: tetratricopeptide repeat protein [Candidatus Omnitrophota bacterium]
MAKNKPAWFIISCLLVIAAACSVVYANSVRGQFIWDDYHLVKDNVNIRDARLLPNIFLEDLGKGAGVRYSFYRPIQSLSYFFDRFVWGAEPQGYHVTNVILHVLASWACFWLLYVLFGDILLAAVPALLFAVHPVHTEAVAYISGRADPIAAIFMLSSLSLYILWTGRRNNAIYALSLALALVSLLSRENAIILPFLIMLYHYVFRIKADIKRVLPFAGFAVIYAVIRLTVLKHLISGVSCETSVLQRIPGAFAALAGYARLLVLPFGLHMEYGRKIFGITDPQVIAGICLAAGIAYSLYIYRYNKVVVFSLLWFILTLLPTANIYPINAYMAEHWLYVPSIGFFLLAGWCLKACLGRRHLRVLGALLITLIVLYYALLTIRQTGYWIDALGFYERTLKYSPESWRVYNSMGVTYDERGMTDKAINALETAIRLNPRHNEAYSNPGAIYAKKGDLQKAIDLLNRSLDLDDSYDMTYYNLGKLYTDTKQYPEAIGAYRKAIECNPYNAAAHNNIAVLYLYYSGNPKQAAMHAETAGQLGHRVDPRFMSDLRSRNEAIAP